jgi:hypothetical protein
MKRFLLSVLVVLYFHHAFSQQASQSQFRQEKADQLNILQSSLALHESQEDLFWPIYEQYEQKLSKLKESTVESLRTLTLNVDEMSAFGSVQNLLLDQHKEAALKKEYFDKIIASTNGTVALQFLQGEALYDLLLKSRLYEKLQWEHPSWTPSVLKDELLRQSLTETTLGVMPADSTKFRTLMSDFDFDYSRVVGHQFAFYEQYVESASEWTPGQCKQLGNNFLKMQISEVKVKDQYFNRFNESFGPSFAARFIALQEYFNLMSKLKVWSDYLSMNGEAQR